MERKFSKIVNSRLTSPYRPSLPFISKSALTDISMLIVLGFNLIYQESKDIDLSREANFAQRGPSWFPPSPHPPPLGVCFVLPSMAQGSLGPLFWADGPGGGEIRGYGSARAFPEATGGLPQDKGCFPRPVGKLLPVSGSREVPEQC